MDIFKIKPNLGEFGRIVLLYKGKDKKIYLGHSFYYGGRDGAEYLLFLYRDALPEGDFLTAWNKLDETSVNIAIVNEVSHTTAIDDFLCAHNPTLHLSDIRFITMDNFSDIKNILNEVNLQEDEVIGLVTFH